MGEGFSNFWNFLPVPKPLATIHKTTAVWAVGFLFRDMQLSLELWNVIAGILAFNDS